MENYYQISDLEINATLEEVKASFKKSIAKIDLESNGDDKLATDRYQEIVEAYHYYFKKYHYDENDCLEEYVAEINKQIENSLNSKGYFHLEQLREKIDDYGSKFLNVFLVLYGIGLTGYLGYLIYDYPRSLNYFFDNILTEIDYFIAETKAPLGYGILIWFVLGIGMVIALWIISVKSKNILREVYRNYNIQAPQNTDCENTKSSKVQGTSNRGCFLDAIIIILDLVIAIIVIAALEWLLFTYCSFNSYIMLAIAIAIFGIITLINARIMERYFPNIGAVRNPNYKS